MHNEKLLKPDLNDICHIESELISSLKSVISHGIFSNDISHEELGELVDMVKDMAETKKDCWKAAYYESIVCAMEESEENDWSMGYNPNRSSNGRYAKTGTGDRTSGYVPITLDRIPETLRDRPYDYISSKDYIMGYDPNRSMEDAINRSKYGDTYRDYENAKRHYSETRSVEDKNKMDEKAKIHAEQSIETLKEIWKTADPSLKKEMKMSLNALVSEIPV